MSRTSGAVVSADHQLAGIAGVGKVQPPHGLEAQQSQGHQDGQPATGNHDFRAAPDPDNGAQGDQQQQRYRSQDQVGGHGIEREVLRCASHWWDWRDCRSPTAGRRKTQHAQGHCCKQARLDGQSARLLTHRQARSIPCPASKARGTTTSRTLPAGRWPGQQNDEACRYRPEGQESRVREELIRAGRTLPRIGPAAQH